MAGDDDVTARVGPNVLVLREGDLEPLGAVCVRAFADRGHRRVACSLVAIQALDLLVHLTEDGFVESDSRRLLIAHEVFSPRCPPGYNIGLGSPRGCAASHGGG